MKFLTLLAVLLLGLGVGAPAIAAPNNTLPVNGDVLLCSGRPWIDVRCNGALGDDINDDTAAINTTVAAAITGNFPVHFSAGIYKVTSKLTFDYAGIAGNGLQIISRGAVLDGRSITSGNVLQIQCSGGTVGSPVTCGHLLIQGDFYIQGSTPAYVVVLGKADLSDIHNAAKIEHLVITNASAATGAGGIQANYLTDGDLWLSSTTAGGNTNTAAIALEQVQQSRLSGAGVSTAPSGANAAALLMENGATAGNLFAGFMFNANTCLSITSPSAVNNTFMSPAFPCAVAVNGSTSAGNNLLVGPTFSGPTPGPLSGGISIVGRGSLNRYTEPASSNLSVYGVDDGTIVSSKNASGSVVTYNGNLSSAGSLPVSLPSPAQVGQGWTMGFVTDANKAVVLTSPGGSKILAGSIQLGTLTVGPGNFEVAILVSDGTNFRLEYATTNTKQLNGIDTSHFPSNWFFPPGPGYQATQGDNGSVLSSALATSGMTITLPQTSAIQPGWTLGAAADGFSLRINVNATNGGQLIQADGAAVATYKFSGNPSPTANYHGFQAIEFDGTNFRVVSSEVDKVYLVGAVGDGVTDNCATGQAAVARVATAQPVVLRFGPGIFLFSCPLTSTNHSVVIDGAGLTELRFTNSTDGVVVNFSGEQQVELRNIKVTTTSATVGNGVRLIYTANLFNNRSHRSVTLSNVVISGVDTTTQGWAKDLYCTDCNFTNVDNSYFMGISVLGSADDTAAVEADNTITPYGVYWDGLHFPTDLKFTNTWFMSLNVGAHFQDTVEGVQITQSSFVFVGMGVEWIATHPGAAPDFVAQDNNLNVFKSGFYLSGAGISEPFITNNLFYHHQKSASSATLITLNEVVSGFISGNIIEGLLPTTSPATTGINIVSGLDNCGGLKISNNHFGDNSLHFFNGITTTNCAVDITDNSFSHIEGTALTLGSTYVFLSKNRFQGIPGLSIVSTSTTTVYGEHSAIAFRNVTGNVPNNVSTAISWNFVGNDTDGFWNVATPTRLTILAGRGFKKVRIWGQLDWASNASGTRSVSILKNGVSQVGLPIVTASAVSGIDTVMATGLSATIDVADGDYFEMYAIQTSGGTLNVIANTWMSIMVID